jgi:hypothetical protein
MYHLRRMRGMVDSVAVRDALLAKADFFARIGDKVASWALIRVLVFPSITLHHGRVWWVWLELHHWSQDQALTAYDTAMAKTVGAGPRIDVVFASMRVALFAADVHLLKTKIDEASKYAHAFACVCVPWLC